MKKPIQNRYLLLSSAKYRINTVSVVFCIFLIALTACTEEAETEPKLNTLEASTGDITSTTAILKGEFQTLGNMHITEYGIEISKSMLFSPSVNKGYSTPAVIGVFQAEFTGLDPATIYYYRAYATINTAQVYPEKVRYLQFTTKPAGK